ncbi:hypothetical protein Dsin_006683 [Dipteronia sinensis]|uniref:Uncharacterized protein n=1 Tax=Dipteronia sinensis TaxID=43782 RepID=A0AAE0EFV1_9ROSI|nr:hypothetical protein Dsin_006683 [Dipteronia sinensis]
MPKPEGGFSGQTSNYQQNRGPGYSQASVKQPMGGRQNVLVWVEVDFLFVRHVIQGHRGPQAVGSTTIGKTRASVAVVGGNQQIDQPSRPRTQARVFALT